MNVGILVLLAGLPQEAPETEKPIPMDVVWDKGLRFRSKDKSYDIHLGGRIFLDAGLLSADRKLESDIEPLEDGAEIRSARLRTNGRLFDRLDFSLSADFAGGKSRFKTAWVQFPGLPLSSTLKIGLQKEPFGLEKSSLLVDSVFLERGLGSKLLDLRNPGALWRTSQFDNRTTFTLGAFLETDDTAVALDDGTGAVMARATALPWWEEDGERLVHLGASYTRRSPLEDEVSFDHRPETHLAPAFVDTGTFEADRVDALVLEGAMLVGPVTFQTELFQAWAHGPGSETTHLRGGYCFVSLMLTGERRPYRVRRGAFRRVSPRQNFFEGGLGAWELAVRKSWLDLDDAPIRGGTLDNTTLGLTWHLNDHVRIIMNGIRSEQEEGGHADMLVMRFTLVF